MAWSVDFDPRALKELEKLDRISQRRVVSFLQQRIAGAAGPRSSGKTMTGDKVGLWRYRVGDYRVICGIIDGSQSVFALRVAHRREVYR